VAVIVGKTLPQQLFALAALPITTSATIRRCRLTWYGEVQPTPMSRSYTLRLTYAGGNRTPTVTIVRPQLRIDADQNLPHTYSGNELCLCYPEQWNAGQLISRTIIPWASEWLLHFEIYTVTGEWHGGGHEPAVTR